MTSYIKKGTNIKDYLKKKLPISELTEIFEINYKSKLKYNLSYIQLYLLLKKINEYEPSLIKLIVSFI